MKWRISCLAFAIGSLALTGAAAGQVGTLWLQNTDGGNSVTVGPSETAVIQLWLEIEPDVTLLLVYAQLAGYDASGGIDLGFEVRGFVDHVNPGLMQRVGRGPVEGDVPHGSISQYAYEAVDMNRPLTGDSGTAGPATMLLDEIIIAGLEADSAPTWNVVEMNGPGTEPPVFLLGGDPIGGWYVHQMIGALGLGTGYHLDPFIVNIGAPEPGMLALLSVGALAIIRRRRRS